MILERAELLWLCWPHLKRVKKVKENYYERKKIFPGADIQQDFLRESFEFSEELEVEEALETEQTSKSNSFSSEKIQHLVYIFNT